jgi:hypothetical protein
MKYFIQCGHRWLWVEKETWHILMNVSLRANRNDWYLVEGGGISYLIKLKTKKPK